MIPYEKGLLGHSDADVLAHAAADALLGAAALGDIGALFPDSDPQYRGADSLWLLSQVADRVRQAGYAVSNLDATVLAQAPKLAPYVQQMRERLAAACGVEPGQVSVKATTEEGPVSYTHLVVLSHARRFSRMRKSFVTPKSRWSHGSTSSKGRRRLA